MKLRRLLVFALVLFTVKVAHADSRAARALFDQATAAYALGNYAKAADLYEQAFEQKADAALLYNAAQAHRLANNKPRALLLYKNYLRVYGAKAGNRVEAQNQVASLETEIANEQAAPKPVEKPPIDKPPIDKPHLDTAPTLTTMPPVEAASAVDSNTITVKADDRKRPLYKKGWFWGAVLGGVAVVGIAVGLGVGLGLPPKAASTSLGTVNGN